MIDFAMLELRKNRRTLLGIAGVFAASLPLEAWALRALACYPFLAGVNVAGRLWIALGLPGLALLLGSSAGAALRRESSRGTEDALPISPYRRAWTALAAAALQEGILITLFVLAEALISSLPGQREWGAHMLPLMGWGWQACGLLFFSMCALIASFICAYAVNSGVLGGLAGLGLTVLPALLLLPGFLIPLMGPILESFNLAASLASAVYQQPWRMLPALALTAAGFAFALNWTVTRVERAQGAGWVRAAAVVAALVSGPLLGYRAAARGTEDTLFRWTDAMHESAWYGKFRAAAEDAAFLLDFEEERDTEKRFYGLGRAVKLAVEQHQTQDARRYAEELLALAPKHRGNWNYGNAVFEGNLGLGRLALEGGDIPEAKRRLLAAGKTPGSPKLSSFGPDMSLAEELLRRGERAAVEEFLRECRLFWKDGGPELDRLEKRVRRGGSDLRGGYR